MQASHWRSDVIVAAENTLVPAAHVRTVLHEALAFTLPFGGSHVFTGHFSQTRSEVRVCDRIFQPMSQVVRSLHSSASTSCCHVETCKILEGYH